MAAKKYAAPTKSTAKEMRKKYAAPKKYAQIFFAAIFRCAHVWLHCTEMSRTQTEYGRV